MFTHIDTMNALQEDHRKDLQQEVTQQKIADHAAGGSSLLSAATHTLGKAFIQAGNWLTQQKHPTPMQPVIVHSTGKLQA